MTTLISLFRFFSIFLYFCTFVLPISAYLSIFSPLSLQMFLLCSFLYSLSLHHVITCKYFLSTYMHVYKCTRLYMGWRRRIVTLLTPFHPRKNTQRRESHLPCPHFASRVKLKGRTGLNPAVSSLM